MKKIFTFFFFLLIGNLLHAQTLIRGPYLTMANQTSVVITWRTDIPTSTKVTYGLLPGSSSGGVVVNTLVTEHVVKLTGLNAETKYFYTIGTNTTMLQGNAENYFITHPITSSTYNKPIRILAVGDVAKATMNEAQVRDAFINYMDTNYVNGYLMLGDNAYENGFDSDFQNGFFNYFQQNITKHTVLWPALGNHEYDNNSVLRQTHAIPYYDIFTLPTNGECGGVSSNTEMYYSFNIGNIHFINLDSYGLEQVGGNFYGLNDTSNSPQVQWLKQDLNSNNLPWVIVSFHHAPYCMGTHNSDNELDLASIRENLNPILERYNVDLVLTGHCHTYQRSGYIHHHYGMEPTFDSTQHVVQTSSGADNGLFNSCPYVKNSIPAKSSDSGLVYAVVGSGSAIPQFPQTSWPHAAMYYSNYLDNGALLLTVQGNQLKGEWITNDTSQVVKDEFNIYKNVNRVHSIKVDSGEVVTLTASWFKDHDYHWSNGDSTKQITVQVDSNQLIKVSNTQGCITDSFYIELNKLTTINNIAKDDWTVSPNPADNIIKISGVKSGTYRVVMMDMRGKTIYQKPWNPANTQEEFMIPVRSLPTGSYILSLVENAQTRYYQRVLVAHQ